MHVSQHQPSTGPEPAAGASRRSLYVPVRRGPAGSVIRLWRTPFGTRTAVAFTSDRRLRSVLGPTQAWIRLSEAALRRMAEPLGAVRLTVDPVLTARPPAAWSRESAAPAPQAGATETAEAEGEATGAPGSGTSGAEAPETGTYGRDAAPAAP
ncbi:SAV_915 family protein [Streptomyces sp. V4-01]|uniref:SAV_915 family protein n=1 Tax=Actinacidiphila polyblastidii TaxID=3110430 RepID=A0ABU7P9Z6_9ACTN|nr:SAV_915 family protein [Streptomyces sp. V4-01]